jgi:hypothetical protein
MWQCVCVSKIAVMISIRIAAIFTVCLCQTNTVTFPEFVKSEVTTLNTSLRGKILILIQD